MPYSSLGFKNIKMKKMNEKTGSSLTTRSLIIHKVIEAEVTV